MRRIFLFAAAVLAPCCAHAAEATPTFYTDARTGCQIGNFNPRPALTVEWNGPCVDGKAQGRGIATWLDGGKAYFTSEGNYQAGIREGRTLTILSDGTRTEAEVRGGRVNGRCIDILASGARFEGQCVDGMREGKGRITFPDGDRYEGQVHNNKYNGRGVYIKASGLVYEGDFADGKWHGRGRLVGSNGAWYEGEFRNGQMEGVGVYVFGDGAFYQGRWRNDLPDGEGTYRGLTQGNQIAEWTGEWHAGCLRDARNRTAAVLKSRQECGFD